MPRDPSKKNFILFFVLLGASSVPQFSWSPPPPS